LALKKPGSKGGKRGAKPPFPSLKTNKKTKNKKRRGGKGIAKQKKVGLRPNNDKTQLTDHAEDREEKKSKPLRAKTGEL